MKDNSCEFCCSLTERTESSDRLRPIDLFHQIFGGSRFVWLLCMFCITSHLSPPCTHTHGVHFHSLHHCALDICHSSLTSPLLSFPVRGGTQISLLHTARGFLAQPRCVHHSQEVQRLAAAGLLFWLKAQEPEMMRFVKQHECDCQEPDRVLYSH